MNEEKSGTVNKKSVWPRFVLRLLLGVLCVVLLIVVGLWLLGTSDFCGNKISSEILSPDHKLKAVTFVRDCGAATDFSTQVSILPANQRLPNDSGNIFVEDSDHGAAKTLDVQVNWIAPRKVSIKHDRKARIFKSEKEIQVWTWFFQLDVVKIDYGSFGAG